MGPRTRLVMGFARIMARMLAPWAVAGAVICAWLVTR